MFDATGSPARWKGRATLYREFVMVTTPPPNPIQDARLWYGIGLLYDCYGSYGYAIEAFNACLKMDPNFELDHEASWSKVVALP